MNIATASTAQTASLHEIFSGIQGEGILVGVRQIFLRLHGCQLHCRYCDTPASHGAPPAQCALEQAAGRRDMRYQANPLTLDEMLQAIRQLHAGFPHHSLSLTGGEPLLHVPLLSALLPALRDIGLPAYLETNGTLAHALAELTLWPEYLAMDIKLPSVTGQAGCWEQHAAFLAVALARMTVADAVRRLQVKIVFGEKSLAEIAQAAELVAAYHADLPCVLQPVTPRGEGPAAPSPQVVLEAQRLAATRLTCVRVIPQTHVLMGQR